MAVIATSRRRRGNLLSWEQEITSSLGLLVMTAGINSEADRFVVDVFFMQLSPSTRFVSLAQAVVFRRATLAEVWIRLSVTAGIGVALFLLALLRFRRSMAAARGQDSASERRLLRE
ncbi:hypothetical protein [Thiohalomonas denitrificans]|uniref:hypothetical protein n=1 Tax=Thiohalomonas denitrificans TaxID=415747 RepID=UPI0026F0EB93|nr:hypothetical protein [Thiohalomonas denitrificans]